MTVKPQAYGKASAISLTGNSQRTVITRASGKDLKTSDSEWEGISDFPEDQKPQILILDRLLEDLNQTPTPVQASRRDFRNDVLINKSGGTATVRDHILAK